MSTYSDQISAVLESKLIPKMNSLANDVARIEPYSYSSAALEDYKRQLDYYSMIYDFLQEYALGEEEMDNAKLVNITRLLNAPVRETFEYTYNATKQQRGASLSPGYYVYIDKSIVDSTTLLIPGTIVDIVVQYVPSREYVGDRSIVVSANGVVHATTEFITILQSRMIPLSSGGGVYTVIPQAYLDGIPIAPLQPPIVIPIKYTIDDVYYYGATVPAATEAQIRALTKIIEPRGNKTVLFSATNQTLYFAYPQSYGTLSSIIDENGFDITAAFTLRPGVLFNLQSPNYGSGTGFYNVYEYNNLTTVSGFQVTFNF